MSAYGWDGANLFLRIDALQTSIYYDNSSILRAIWMRFGGLMHFYTHYIEYDFSVCSSLFYGAFTEDHAKCSRRWLVHFSICLDTDPYLCVQHYVSICSTKGT